MKLSPNFTLEELVWSDTGDRLEIDNTPPADLMPNLERLARQLEKIRSILGHAMHINSGYRCEKLNTAIGGSSRSMHMRGLAADFVCPAFGTPLAVCRLLEPYVDELEVDQLIFEHTWTHCGFAEDGAAPRHQILTLMSGKKYASGIVERA